MSDLHHIVFSEIAGRRFARHDEERDVLLLTMLGQEYVVSRDAVLLHGHKAPDSHQTVVLDYLQSGGRGLVQTPWRSLRDFSDRGIPDFRNKVELPVAHCAKDIIARASGLLPMIGGETSPNLISSDMAFTVRALPTVQLHIELCCESHDFPAEAWILFSHNAAEFLSLQSLLTLAELFKERLLGLVRIY